MNKFIIAVVVVAVVAGIIIAFQNFSGAPEEPASPSATPQPSITPQPLEPTPTPQVTPSPTRTLTPQPTRTPSAPQGILDRIEAAIRAKLRR